MSDMNLLIAALKGTAAHIRACPEYRKLLGDCDFIDQAVAALASPAVMAAFDRAIALSSTTNAKDER